LVCRGVELFECELAVLQPSVGAMLNPITEIEIDPVVGSQELRTVDMARDDGIVSVARQDCARGGAESIFVDDLCFGPM
jgi:hypothetical protein